ncbi:pyocin knob domain-containing protein, partial [Limosilactobacillus reuteri]
TQLSNVIQSKVSSSDFNDLKDKTTWKSTDSIDLNTAVSQQKIFVKGGSNLPPGSYWWYVRVEPGYASRIAQYAVSDRDNIHYSRQYDGSKWSA